MAEGAARVLVVEDDAALRRLLLDEVSDRGLEARGAGSAEEARELLEEWRADVVVTDIRLPGASGRDLLRWGAALPEGPDFLLVTAFGTVREAVECLREGAADFLTKPLDLDHLATALERILEVRALRRRVAGYAELLDDAEFHGMVGRSEVMRRLYDRIRRVAGAEGPVLVVGESGTGKELVSRAVHAESRRASGPFIAVNCAGIPADLMESEFFGHAEGAFTGATSSRQGLFQEADGGTMMLDEIGEMPASMQAKLLRALEDGRIRPVGANTERELDVRIIAATNRDLRQEVESGEFREDLFFRLETFTLRVPPLRERGDDLDLLLAHFLGLFSARAGRRVRGFSAAAMRRLHAYPFAGNVRELRNVVERAVTFATGEIIGEESLPERVRQARGRDLDGGGAGLLSGLLRDEDDVLPTLEEVELRYIRHVLHRVNGNKRRAAALLGVSRRTLYRRLEKVGEPEAESGADAEAAGPEGRPG
ncbi:MAG TPA: sigma-54 dependent transcriptional regulator [Longimicrobiales bacterium]|nr:sigma-54 dependent transcriptional regulator [Longimicrobiales bacterium]